MSHVKIEVSVDSQEMRLLEDGKVRCRYPISTGRNGTGCEEGSLRTPTGSFLICRKLGAAAPEGTIFKGRKAVGSWTPGEESEEDLVLTRILWLDGCEPHNANTRERYIYIHGTNQESLIGQPASHGCVRMRNADIIDLFDRVEEGTPVEII